MDQLLPERTDGALSWDECGIVAEPSHFGFCSVRELSTQVTLLGDHALDVVEGFIVRVVRFHVDLLDGFWSSVKSVTASSLASSQFTEEGKLRERPLATVIRSVDGNVSRFALRSLHE